MSILVCRNSDADGRWGDSVSMTKSIRRSLSALKGAPLSIRWRTGIGSGSGSSVDPELLVLTWLPACAVAQTCTSRVGVRCPPGEVGYLQILLDLQISPPCVQELVSWCNALSVHRPRWSSLALLPGLRAFVGLVFPERVDPLRWACMDGESVKRFHVPVVPHPVDLLSCS